MNTNNIITKEALSDLDEVFAKHFSMLSEEDKQKIFSILQNSAESHLYESANIGEDYLASQEEEQMILENGIMDDDEYVNEMEEDDINAQTEMFMKVHGKK